jgi:hypothetical protein
MNRLYNIDVDKTRWNVVEINNKNYYTYKLIDKENDDTYILENIIGLEQINENEFLVYKRYSFDEFVITRYQLTNSKYNKIFEKIFNHFHFITDDRIMFTYCDRSANYRNYGIYSINDNDYVEDGKWLERQIVKCVYDNNELDDTRLYVEMDNYSSVLGNTKLIFTVNPETLQPNSE